MRIFEPHIHMYSRTMEDYSNMSLCGIETIVEPSFWLGSERRSPGTYFDYFRHILEFEPTRAETYGIKHYSCIAMNPKEANNYELAVQVIEGMEPYLDHPNCLAVGEVGLDKNSDAEEAVLRLQVKLAQRKALPILIHLPHTGKVAGIERIIKVLKEEQVVPSMVLIDHNTEETVEKALAYGAWTGLTIYPTKVSPERAVKIFKTYGLERMLISSSADWGLSNPLNVPYTCRELRQAGFSEEDISKLVWDNPRAFYALSGKLKY